MHRINANLLVLYLGSTKVDSIEVSPAITSAEVTWVKLNSNESDVFELQYFPVVFPSHRVSVNTTLKSHSIIGLIPKLRYQFQVRVYTSEGLGEWVSSVITLNRTIREYLLCNFGEHSHIYPLYLPSCCEEHLRSCGQQHWCDDIVAPTSRPPRVEHQLLHPHL